MSKSLGIVGDSNYNALIEYLPFVSYSAELTLRDVEQIVTLSLVAALPNDEPIAEFHLYAGLLILKILAPTLYEKAKRGQVNSADIFPVFEFPSGSSGEEAQAVWAFATLDEGTQLFQRSEKQKEQLFGREDPKDALRRVAAECFDTFQLLL